MYELILFSSSKQFLCRDEMLATFHHKFNQLTEKAGWHPRQEGCSHERLGR